MEWESRRGVTGAGRGWYTWVGLLMGGRLRRQMVGCERKIAPGALTILPHLRVDTGGSISAPAPGLLLSQYSRLMKSAFKVKFDGSLESCV